MIVEHIAVIIPNPVCQAHTVSSWLTSDFECTGYK